MGSSAKKSKNGSLSQPEKRKTFHLIPDRQKRALQEAFVGSDLRQLDREISSAHGVYGLFYLKPDPLYRNLLRSKKDDPLYIGKAGRSGLAGRLGQHRQSILDVGMNPDHFRCRFLEIDSEADTFAAEMILQEIYKPLWNTVLKGFGNKNVGRARTGQIRSRWDTLHQGRGWAKEMSDRQESKQAIRQEMKLFFQFKAERQAAGDPDFSKSDWLGYLKKNQ